MSNIVSSGKGIGIYRLNTPTLTDNQEASAGFDVNGNLLVNVAAGGASTVDQSTFVPGTTPGTLSMGVYETTPETLTNNQSAAIGVDANRRVIVTLGTLISGEDLTNNVLKVEQRFIYAHIAAGQATTTVKSSAGFLHSVTFNGAATATNVTTIYDNTAGSGTVIAIPAATTVTIPVTLVYDISFATGLTFVTATANGSDMTVSYR